MVTGMTAVTADASRAADLGLGDPVPAQPFGRETHPARLGWPADQRCARLSRRFHRSPPHVASPAGTWLAAGLRRVFAGRSCADRGLSKVHGQIAAADRLALACPQCRAWLRARQHGLSAERRSSRHGGMSVVRRQPVRDEDLT